MKHKFGASPSIVAHARAPLLLVLLLLSGSGSLAVAQNPRASGFRLQEATIAGCATRISHPAAVADF
jgi:hypothetical protein